MKMLLNPENMHPSYLASIFERTLVDILLRSLKIGLNSSIKFSSSKMPYEIMVTCLSV